MKHRHAASILAAFLLAALPALAGVKYWDNPDFRAFDVGDYVTNGLVLHYDGIRNAGADADHSDTTDTWVNLASDGAYPMGWCSWILNSADSKYYIRNGNTESGSWAANGFVFDGTAVFAATNITFGIGATYTHQLVMTASTADLKDENGTTGYIFRPGKSWENNAIAIRQTSNGSTTPANAVYVIDRTRFGANTPRANFSNANPRYATVLADNDAIRIFEGTEIPTASTGGNSYKVGSRTATDNNNWFAYGAQYDGSPRSPRNNLQAFNGTLHAARYYSTALTYEDLAWNRVVDEARFFGGRAPIPATNIVVATSAPGVEGDQPCGAYALDEDGYTFTAPAQRTVDGKRYILEGYTLATWNGSDWSEAETVESGSFTASGSDKVLLTWQYARPEGEGQFKAYDVDDYVQDGLVLHYDGIRNVGADAAHDPAARQWMNLAPGYEGRWPMDWCSYVESSANNHSYAHNNYTQGKWTDDGFVFNGKAYFAKWSNGDPFAIPDNFTVQISVTGAIADQLGDPAYLWTGQPGWSYGSVAMRKSNNSAANGNANSVYYVNSTIHPAARPNFYPAGAKPSYVTAIVDYDDTKTTYIFEGTARPTAGGRDAPAITGSSPATNMTWFSVGGFHNRTGTAANLQSFNGTVHSFRFYNRALTDAEVAQNRKVDEFRFHGRYVEPNVIVQSTYSYLEGYDMCGAYEVDDSYTFVAPAGVTAPNGVEYACAGYSVERRAGAVGWEFVGTYESSSYRYESSAGTVRITWLWKPVRGLRSAANYGFDDLSTGGLRLHYDGLANAGADAERSTDATKWANLGSDGAAMDLTLSKGTGDAGSGWSDQGFYFGGHAKFESPSTTWTTNSFTVQALVDAAFADNASESGNYLAATAWNRFGLQIWGYEGRTRARLNALGESYMDPRPQFSSDSGGLDYVTAIQNDAAKTTTIFPGISAPTSGTAADDGFRHYTACTNEYASVLRLGGWGGNINTSDQFLVGTVKSFRYYDRVLTEEELVRNRNVDSVRYFGALAVTNLVVEAEDGTLAAAADPAPGAYFVEGSWTFELNAAIPERFGYRLYDWDEASGQWINPRSVSGTSYTHDVTDPTAKVRLFWREIKPLVLVIR